MKMEGMWKKAFDLDHVAIGDGQLALSYMPRAPMPELGEYMSQRKKEY